MRSKPDPGRAFFLPRLAPMATSKSNSRQPARDAGLALALTLDWPCLRLADAGKPSEHIVLDVSVSPNAKKTEVVGWHDGALRVRLNAPPVDGAANEALRRWLSDEIGIPMANVTLLRGATGRRKQLSLDANAATIAAWLKSLQDKGALAGKQAG